MTTRSATATAAMRCRLAGRRGSVDNGVQIDLVRQLPSATPALQRATGKGLVELRGLLQRIEVKVGDGNAVRKQRAYALQYDTARPESAGWSRCSTFGRNWTVRRRMARSAGTPPSLELRLHRRGDDGGRPVDRVHHLRTRSSATRTLPAMPGQDVLRVQSRIVSAAPKSCTATIFPAASNGNALDLSMQCAYPGGSGFDCAATRRPHSRASAPETSTATALSDVVIVGLAVGPAVFLLLFEQPPELLQHQLRHRLGLGRCRCKGRHPGRCRRRRTHGDSWCRAWASFYRWTGSAVTEILTGNYGARRHAAAARHARRERGRQGGIAGGPSAGGSAGQLCRLSATPATQSLGRSVSDNTLSELLHHPVLCLWRISTATGRRDVAIDGQSGGDRRLAVDRS